MFTIQKTKKGYRLEGLAIVLPALSEEARRQVCGGGGGFVVIDVLEDL